MENRRLVGLLENGYFTYDAMGNMLTDSRKGLEFSYNLANLPESVEGADGASLTHIYLLLGINRLRILAKSFSRSIPFLQYFSIFA